MGLLAFDKTVVDNFFVGVFATAIHDLWHQAGCGVHHFLPEGLDVNVCDDWYLLLQELEHDATLVANAKQGYFECEKFCFFGRLGAACSTIDVPM